MRWRIPGRRAWRHADRHGRRRHLHDDEFRHLFDRSEWSQDDRRRLRQRRVRSDQPAAAGQGRAGLQQSLDRLPGAKSRRAASCRFRQARGIHGGGRAACESLAELGAALEWAKGNDRTTVLSIASDAYAWVPGDADWDVGVPEVSSRDRSGPRAENRNRSALSVASECEVHESETRNCPHRLVERRSC